MPASPADVRRLLGLLTLLVLLVKPVGAVLPRHGLNLGQSLVAGRRSDEGLGFLADFERQAAGRAPRPSSLTHCGEPEHIDWRSVDRERCPESCPFLVEDVSRLASGPISGDSDALLLPQVGEHGQCWFVCVKTAGHCALLNPNASVADADAGLCRPCMVAGCEVCSRDGTDTCLECAPGYWLARDGAVCRTRFDLVWQTGFAVLAVVVVLLACWVLHLSCRPVTNKEGLQHGSHHRDRSRLTQGGTNINSSTDREDFRTAREEDEEEEDEDPAAEDPQQPSARTRRLLRSWKEWPLTTNLFSTAVAGPGLVAFINFQGAVILWALGVALSWMVVASIYDGDLLVVGTQVAESPRHYCFLLSWGQKKEEQQHLVRAAWILCVYVVSFVMVLVYSALQMRYMERLDTTTTSMKDFVALASGLPPMSGSRNVEEELRDLFRKETGEPVVGVVALWDMHDHWEEITDALDQEMSQLPLIRSISMTKIGSDEEAGWLHNLEKSVLQAYTGVNFDAADDGAKPEIGDLLRSMSTSGFAIIVFDTEQARDAAMEKVSAQGGMKMDNDFTAHLEQMEAEPITVEWSNFTASDTWMTTARRWVVAISEILFALLVWVLVFYTPYVYFILGFSYKNGTKVSFGAELSLTLVVAIGNLVMYAVCFDAATRLRLRYKDDTQAAYTAMYFVACLFNVVADLVVTFEIAQRMMANQGLRNAEGVPLQDLPQMEVFEAFPMQRELGNQLMAYAFPATFLLPYILEPFALIFVPYWLMNRLVRTHPECTDKMIEKAFECVDMDLARYADILLNVGIAVLMLAFPPGFTHMTFLALAFSHIYILAYDHWRVLRATKVCLFAGSRVERTTQLLLSIPCGLLAAICVLVSNPLHGTPGHLENMALVVRIVGAFVAHVVLHVVLIVFLVPRFRTDHSATDVAFKELASTIPRSWFTLSPTYCLRSQHIYGHSPPCRPFIPGKEMILQANPKACSFYSAENDTPRATWWNPTSWF